VSLWTRWFYVDLTNRTADPFQLPQSCRLDNGNCHSFDVLLPSLPGRLSVAWESICNGRGKCILAGRIWLAVCYEVILAWIHIDCALSRLSDGPRFAGLFGLSFFLNSTTFYRGTNRFLPVHWLKHAYRWLAQLDISLLFSLLRRFTVGLGLTKPNWSYDHPSQTSIPFQTSHVQQIVARSQAPFQSNKIEWIVQIVSGILQSRSSLEKQYPTKLYKWKRLKWSGFWCLFHYLLLCHLLHHVLFQQDSFWKM
jgi:hypothetical protein